MPPFLVGNRNISAILALGPRHSCVTPDARREATTTMLSRLAFFLCLALPGTLAFVTDRSSSSIPRQSTTALFDGDGTGGWGIGGSRQISKEEFARGERTAFDGYKMQERGDFMRSLKQEQDAQMKSEMDELLGVAKIAGLKVKDPKSRLNKFEKDIFEVVDDDDLDVSID
jgi:hypothetical protein